MWIRPAGALSRWNHNENVKFSVSHCLPFGYGYDSTHDVTAKNSVFNAGLGRAATKNGFSERG